MDLFKSEMKKEMKLLGFKSPKKVVYSTDHQIGKTNIKRDKVRKALPPGKRVSKTGKIYYESRKNRTDINGI
jgi:hypothetical protein